MFNGKDLTGLKQRAADGMADVIVDGQPYLRLQDKSNLTTRRFGDYHLRLEFRVEKGTIISMVSDGGPRLTASTVVATPTSRTLNAVQIANPQVGRTRDRTSMQLSTPSISSRTCP